MKGEAGSWGAFTQSKSPPRSPGLRSGEDRKGEPFRGDVFTSGSEMQSWEESQEGKAYRSSDPET